MTRTELFEIIKEERKYTSLPRAYARLADTGDPSPPHTFLLHSRALLIHILYILFFIYIYKYIRILGYGSGGVFLIRNSS